MRRTLKWTRLVIWWIEHHPIYRIRLQKIQVHRCERSSQQCNSQWEETIIFGRMRALQECRTTRLGHRNRADCLSFHRRTLVSRSRGTTRLVTCNRSQAWRRVWTTWINQWGMKRRRTWHSESIIRKTSVATITSWTRLTRPLLLALLRRVQRRSRPSRAVSAWV